MILANHLRQTLLEPLKERQRMEGFEEGYAKGVALSDAAWRAWNARREKAEAGGMQFDEPPPNLGG